MGNVGLGIGARISCIDITAILLEFLHVPEHHRDHDATQRRAVRAASRANDRETIASTTTLALMKARSFCWAAEWMSAMG